MSDPARERLIREVNELKTLILQVAFFGFRWPCCNCGNMAGYENDNGWLSAVEIRQAVESITGKRRGSVFTFAIHELVNEGSLEVNARLKLKITDSEGRS